MDLVQNITCTKHLFMYSKLSLILVVISCNISNISCCVSTIGQDVTPASIDEKTGASGIISLFPFVYNQDCISENKSLTDGNKSCCLRY